MKSNTIQIPDTLKHRLEDMMNETSFNNLSEYIWHLLRKEVARYNASKDGVILSIDDEEKIKERLKQLGYITDE